MAPGNPRMHPAGSPTSRKNDHIARPRTIFIPVKTTNGRQEAWLARRRTAPARSSGTAGQNLGDVEPIDGGRSTSSRTRTSPAWTSSIVTRPTYAEIIPADWANAASIDEMRPASPDGCIRAERSSTAATLPRCRRGLPGRSPEHIVNAGELTDAGSTVRTVPHART